MKAIRVQSLIAKISLDHVWLFAPVALGFVMLALSPLREGDLWWHLKLGEVIASQRQIPSVDSFTFTASGLPFNAAHSWLSDVLFYHLFRAGGVSALLLCQAVAGAGTLGLLVRTAMLRKAPPLIIGVITFLAYLALYPFSTARPQIFSFLFFAVYGWIVTSYRQGRPCCLWLLPVVMAVWCNCHGAWVMGLMLLAAVTLLNFVEEVTGREGTPKTLPLAAWSGAAFLATFLNPRGSALYSYLVTMGGSQVSQQFVSEWQTPVLSDPLAWSFYVLLGGVGFSLAYRRTRPALSDIGILGLFLVLAFRALRMTPFFALVTVPFLAESLGDLDRAVFWPRKLLELKPARKADGGAFRLLNSLFLLVLVLGMVASLPQVRLALSGAAEETLVDAYFPLRAVEVLAGVIDEGGRVFSLPEWGGLLIWKLYPAGTVFVDGRVELCPFEVWEDYLKIAGATEGWQETLEAYAVDYLLLSRERQPALISAAVASEWSCVLYEDAAAVLVTRRAVCP